MIRDSALRHLFVTGHGTSLPDPDIPAHCNFLPWQLMGQVGRSKSSTSGGAESSIGMGDIVESFVEAVAFETNWGN